MVNNVGWADLLPSVATDAAPFVKSLGKFQDSLATYGVGTGIAGLEGLNQVVYEANAARAIWMKPDQEHVKPSLTRLAFGVLNATGYALYGAGAGGGLGRYATGGGLLLVTASNVLKQHFLPAEEMYRPPRPDAILPLHRGDVARFARARPPAAPPGADDRWLRAGELESGTLRPPPASAAEPATVNSVVAATAAVTVPRRGRSRSLSDIELSDINPAPPTGPAAARRGSTGHAVPPSRPNSARGPAR
ncbi:hypothetical protein [Streptomyces sp. 4R-3d]|uniref:hypothetical protein n=1 Tax=Streptomyces sp. 4R-3d TaxID=2559605 RepID=UPI0014304728|nr:hypothetical protein [Streptomyces sp. 4R-3d]